MHEIVNVLYKALVKHVILTFVHSCFIWYGFWQFDPYFFEFYSSAFYKVKLPIL